MILERNGTTTELQLLNLAVSVKLPIKNADVSASSSSTDTINTGTKGKRLSVAGRIPFASADDLTTIIKLGEALNDDGTRAVYTIVDDTADAADITNVKFDGDFDARKIPDLQAWAVTFSLTEHLSTAERVEAQRNAGYTSASASTDTATGTEITDTDSAITDTESDHGMIWQVLKKLDEIIGELEAD
ncbi:hypothetical protein [Oceanobacter sp. 4_MG-2023]|uniref:baseplate complex protein n=1 Tax=Oceanobacter sp. 4_MG-2023 TaxID=3062623 RepID=UPI0027340428|nr:hypothetical protein [Oceanobacter sp. 4_MG-2023]MDP2548909.1 hypothetical protein [Oceanobacter sp. 4_MG-2023]